LHEEKSSVTRMSKVNLVRVYGRRKQDTEDLGQKRGRYT